MEEIVIKVTSLMANLQLTPDFICANLYLDKEI
jgi:hypothetical protein